MKNSITKAQRIAALEQARVKLLGRYYTASQEIDHCTTQLSIIDSQLVVMTGLIDEPGESPDGTE